MNVKEVLVFLIMLQTMKEDEIEAVAERVRAIKQ